MRQICSIAIAVALLAAGSAAAQENRTVDGEALGASAWHPISPAASELPSIPGTDDFILLRNALPDRVQESWRHPDNKPHGPLATIFYERLTEDFFSSQLFAQDFRDVFNAAFASRGVRLADADVDVIDGRTRIAKVEYGNSRCAFILRVFGPVDDNPISAAESNGDRNARIFVCAQGKADTDLLEATARAMLPLFGAEAPESGVLPDLLKRLFTSEKGA